MQSFCGELVIVTEQFAGKRVGHISGSRVWVVSGNRCMRSARNASQSDFRLWRRYDGASAFSRDEFLAPLSRTHRSMARVAAVQRCIACGSGMDSRTDDLANYILSCLERVATDRTGTVRSRPSDHRLDVGARNSRSRSCATARTRGNAHVRAEPEQFLRARDPAIEGVAGRNLDPL